MSGLGLATKQDFSGDINLSSHMGQHLHTRKIQPGMCALGYLHTSTAQGLQPLTETSCSPGKQEAHLGRRRMHSIYLGLFVHSSSVVTVGDGWAIQGLFELKE